MFAKILLVVPVVFSIALQASAHAIIQPPLGVKGTPTRNDVQRPSKQAPCGNVNIAQTIGTTTPIVAAADGTFTATVTNFNASVQYYFHIKICHSLCWVPIQWTRRL